MNQVTRSEWIWVAVAVALLAALTTMPYLVGWQQNTPDRQFGGFLFGLEDMHSYIAKMRYGARDGWLFQIVYTPEPHRGALLFLFHLTLGKLAGWITNTGAHVPAQALILTYHLVRLICNALLGFVGYAFLACVLPSSNTRPLVWLLAMLGGGLGWLTIPLNLPMLPVAFYIPEAFTFLILYGLPHLALARALLLLGWMLLLKTRHSPLLAGLAWMGMTLIVPFYGMVVAALAVVWLVVWGFWLRRLSRYWLGRVIVALLPVVAVVGYTAWAFMREPVFTTWSGQNQLPSPPLGMYLLAYGLWMPCALFGVRTLHRVSPQWALLLVVWPLLALALAYAPIAVQRRLLEGMIFPLSALAALGISKLVHGDIRRFWLMGGVLFVVSLVPAIILVAGGVVTAQTADWPVFLSTDELAALSWLDSTAPPDSVVLSTFRQGTLLPAYAGVRVFNGHGPETLDSQHKRLLSQAFFSGGMDDPQRLALLAGYNVRYVWVGPRERALACDLDACFNPIRLRLRLSFAQGDFALYEVPP